MAVYDNLYVSLHRTQGLMLCFFIVISFRRLFAGHDPKAGEGYGSRQARRKRYDADHVFRHS